jgi:phasin family protein
VFDYPAKLVLEGFPAMAKQLAKRTAKDANQRLTMSGEAAEKMMKGNADALSESGNASKAAVQELTKAYGELAAKNAKNLTAAMQALAAVKSPTEFMELQQRLIKEGVAAAVSDSKHIAQLTTAVFTAAFEPVKKQIESVQKTTRT